MKKLLIIGIVITIVGFFTFPAVLMADEGDAEDFVGVRESENHGRSHTKIILNKPKFFPKSHERIGMILIMLIKRKKVFYEKHKKN